MTSSDRNDSRPFSRNRSQTITVAGEFAGDRVIYEVQTEEWRRKTGRYGRVWSARRRGSLAWNTGATARKALFGAQEVARAVIEAVQQ